MATRKKPIRKRPVSLRVMVTEAERRELHKVADAAGLPISTFVRMMVLAAARQGLSIATEMKKAA